MPIVAYRASLTIVSAAAVVALGGTAAYAGGRPEDTSRSWFPYVSGGYAFAQSDTSNVLDDDWTISGGALYWPSDWAVGLQLDVTYANFDISSEAIQAINTAVQQDPLNAGGIDDGDVNSWQFTVNGIWGPGDRDNGFYLTAGVGAYYLEGTLTQTGLVYYPPFCDPWYWWWCTPGGVGTGSIVQDQDSTTEFGWNAGLGYSFTAGDGQIFMEAKYTEISTDSEDLVYAPLTFGYRW